MYYTLPLPQPPPKKILLAAGGSGGHLFPAQQLAKELEASACSISFMGSGLEKNPFFSKETFNFHEVPARPLRPLLSFGKTTWKSTKSAVSYLRAYRPDLVVSFGSFHTFPVLLAASLLRIPLVLFEANSVMGKVNRFFLPFAKIVAAQFPLSHKRASLRYIRPLPWHSCPKQYSSEEARKRLGLDPNRLTILIMGGSQGAQMLNAQIPLAIPPHAQVIHLTGKENATVTAFYKQAKIPALVIPFSSEMSLIYQASDCAICRAGAATLGELIHFQIPALLIPFPFAADRHQEFNGHFLEKKVGGATMLLQQDASQETVQRAIGRLLDNQSLFRERLHLFKKTSQERESFASLILSL